MRLAGRRGLFRFVGYLGTSTEDVAGVTHVYTDAEVIGPIGKSEVNRVVPVSDLMMPPATAKPEDVAMSPEARVLSHNAHERTRRRRG